MGSDERKDLKRIINQLGTAENILDILSNQISLSDLNTLLLEVFRRRTAGALAGELLKRYATNRFVYPAEMNPIELKRLEIDVLNIAQSALYTPIQLSPVAPLGSCSIVAASDQNKIISALRGTEVVADATNVLALHICNLIKSGKMKSDEAFIRFSTTHRHVRAQKFNQPGQFTHFHLFCMVASGKDSGSYSFEKQTLLEHVSVYQSIFKSLFQKDIKVELNRRDGYTDSEGRFKGWRNT